MLLCLHCALFNVTMNEERTKKEKRHIHLARSREIQLELLCGSSEAPEEEEGEEKTY